MSNRYTTKVAESLKLRGWIDEIQAKALRADNARLKGEVEAWRSTFGTDDVKESAAEFDEQYRKVSELESTLATYKAAVVEAREALESVMRFTRGKYWHTYPNVESVCTDALHTLSALTGDATKTP